MPTSTSNRQRASNTSHVSHTPDGISYPKSWRYQRKKCNYWYSGCNVRRRVLRAKCEGKYFGYSNEGINERTLNGYKRNKRVERTADPKWSNGGKAFWSCQWRIKGTGRTKSAQPLVGKSYRGPLDSREIQTMQYRVHHPLTGKTNSARKGGNAHHSTSRKQLAPQGNHPICWVDAWNRRLPGQNSFKGTHFHIAS